MFPPRPIRPPAGICKHFLHIIALAEEGIWLAGGKVSDYPYLEDSPSFYQELFDTWRGARHDDDVRRRVLEKLRERRRKLLHAYYLDGQED